MDEIPSSDRPTRSEPEARQPPAGPVPHWLQVIAVAAVPLVLTVGLIVDWKALITNVLSDLVVLGLGLAITNLLFRQWQRIQFYRQVSPAALGSLSALSSIAESVAKATTHCEGEVSRVGDVQPAWVRGQEGKESEIDRAIRSLNRLEDTLIPMLDMALHRPELQIGVHDLQDALDVWIKAYSRFLELPGRFERMGGRWIHAFESPDDVARAQAHADLADKALRVKSTIEKTTAIVTGTYIPDRSR